MLDQGGVLVVQDQLLQGAVQVVGLSKAVPRVGLVDHTVFHLSIHAAEPRERDTERQRDTERETERETGSKHMTNQ